ncbi:MAG: hypothetical protein NUV65_03160 [Candidatus Roizmanbacteria bacterium]|nr:hypothetical protein [Candidatus Roizmanbacteria bacterium]
MKNKLAIIFIILVATSLYALTIRGVAGSPDALLIKNNLDQATKPFELSPERGRYAHVFAMAETGRYDLSQAWADAVYPDIGYANGKFYSYFAPGISYLSTPFYLIGKEFDLEQVFTFGFISFMSILALIFLYKIAREIFELPIWASLFAVFAFAFASTAWSYAITLYQHHVTAFLILSSVYAVWRYTQRGQRSFLWSIYVWTAYGIAIFIDYPNAILLLPIMVYFLLSSFSFRETSQRYVLSFRMAMLYTFVAFITLAALHGYHNEYYFGDWKTVSGSIPGYKTIVERDILAQSDTEKEISQLAPQKNIVAFFKEVNVPRGFYTLTVSLDRGIAIYVPLLLLSLLSIYRIRKSITPAIATLLALVGINILLYSSWGDPWGGWAYGPRYLIPSMAILSLFVAFWLSRGEVWKKVIAFILFAYSSAIALLGALTTNAVPPKIEADFLGLKYNFLYNIDFFMDGRSGSFLYNTYFANTISLQDYFLLIYMALLILVTVVLFIVPLFETKHES